VIYKFPYNPGLLTLINLEMQFGKINRIIMMIRQSYVLLLCQTV